MEKFEMPIEAQLREQIAIQLERIAMNTTSIAVHDERLSVLAIDYAIRANEEREKIIEILEKEEER